MGSLLIIGSPAVHSLESSYARALGKLGMQISWWDPEAALARAARGGSAGHFAARFVAIEPWLRKANVELLQEVQRKPPDLILLFATAGVRAGTLMQASILAPRARIYMLYPDSPHGMSAERIACIPACHRVAGSAPPWRDAFAALGARRAEYLPFAADTELHPLASGRGDDPEWDVGFIGTWRPEREAILDSLVDLRVRVWGSRYWKTRTARSGKVRRMWAGGPAMGAAFADACARTAVMLNILDPITWPGPNMRAFELPACGAFALCSRSAAILETFHEGVTIECFDTPAEAREKATHFAKHQDERQRIAQKSRQFVIDAGHTYMDRARTVLSWLSQDA